MSLSYNESIDNNSSTEKILIQKKKFSLTRIMKNKYKLECIIENNNIYLDKIINFQFIKLIYEANKKYFEIIHLDIINDNEAYLYLLVKPTFSEIGIQQRYVSLKLTKYIDHQSTNVYFKGISCPEYGEKINVVKNAIISPIHEINIICNIIHPHKLQFTKMIVFDENFKLPILFETVFGKMLSDIYKQIIHVLECIK
jgi:hypothetical protein